MTESNDNTFAQMGQTYQEKVVQAIIQDSSFAEQVADIMLPKHFDLKYLQTLVTLFFEHHRTFKAFPSYELLEIMVRREVEDALVSRQCFEYLARAKSEPINGDIGYIQHTSLDFVKRQNLKEAMVLAIDKIEQNDYESISGIIKDAMNKGVTRDLGHNYGDGLMLRTQRAERKPISTGWPVVDGYFNGGWERGTLNTFIAPTGAGKSMFLVNCGAAVLEQGYNVLYVTCEMADYKIGLRFDAYFSGVNINDVPGNENTVSGAISEKLQGKLWIKEFPTKTASVQTIRAYVQRLKATKGFEPDMILVDYADLLRSSRGFEQKRFELECVYEELRALAQELNVIIITADQTNRSGLDLEVVTIAQIGEAYSKATVCDVIMTVSRRAEDKITHSGRLFIAKSRLGSDGHVLPFLMNSATVKVTVLQPGGESAAGLNPAQSPNDVMLKRFKALNSDPSSSN